MELSSLNAPQRDAVMRTEGPVLILAGAGSGKTRVLTTRIGYLIDEKKVLPANILAITFTNKAANEMRERVDETVESSTKDMWINTFHSCCVKILRKDINKIGYNRSFIIYDAADQVTLVKDCMKELDISDKLFDVKGVISQISSAKDKLISPRRFKEKYRTDVRMDKVADIYTLYQERLKRNSALDFDDLIVKTIELFRKNEEVLKYYRNKFRYIMVDEYQDTSHAQYKFVRLLASEHQNICVVGDDDQSIYGWRGADIKNILEFEKDYENVHIVKLEQNYRSTQVILDAANHIISNNTERKSKKLWSDKEGGKSVKICQLDDEMDEGDFVCAKIDELVRKEKRSLDDFAVLYRANAQARAIEDALNRSMISYNIYGGTKFYERKEIKDLIAYLRVIVNPQDDISVKRIINVPARGIGLKTIEKMEDRASLKQESIYSVLLDAEDNSDLSTRAKAKVNGFIDIMSILRSSAEVYSVSELIEYTMKITGYLKDLEDNRDKNEKLSNGKYDEYQDRIDNLKELISIALEFENSEDIEGEKNLQTFLESVALSSDADGEQSDSKVSLMTVHTSKGLEFPVVFIVGMEENLFPISRAIKSMSDTDIEEERRLCYVAITRAEEELFITNVRNRTLYGKRNVAIQSRFIEELPEDSIEVLGVVDEGLSYSRANYNVLDKYSKKYKKSMNMDAVSKNVKVTIIEGNKEGSDFALKDSVKAGSKIYHSKFGKGTVVARNGNDLTVAFVNKGIKRLNIEYTVFEVLSI